MSVDLADQALTPTDAHFRLKRTNGGRTIHAETCPRAPHGIAWKWAEGRSLANIMLAAIGSEWASCCCGFVYTYAAALLNRLEGRE